MIRKVPSYRCSKNEYVFHLQTSRLVQELCLLLPILFKAGTCNQPSWFVLLTKYYPDNINLIPPKNEMGGTCSVCGRGEMWWWGIQKVKDHLGDPHIGEGGNIKMDFQEIGWGRVRGWIGFVWHKIRDKWVDSRDSCNATADCNITITHSQFYILQRQSPEQRRQTKGTTQRFSMSRHVTKILHNSNSRSTKPNQPTNPPTHIH
jgi:hypothetical protein